MKYALPPSFIPPFPLPSSLWPSWKMNWIHTGIQKASREKPKAANKCFYINNKTNDYVIEMKVFHESVDEAWENYHPTLKLPSVLRSVFKLIVLFLWPANFNVLVQSHCSYQPGVQEAAVFRCCFKTAVSLMSNLMPKNVWKIKLVMKTLATGI